jgi:hypothetical protein
MKQQKPLFKFGNKSTKVPRNFVDMKTGSLSFADNFLFKYLIESPTRCTLYVFFIPLYFSVHVSGAFCTHHQEHILQRTTIGMCDVYSMLINWSKFGLQFELDLGKSVRVSSQYLLQWINIL